jgi:glucose-fructose oxidoreductase
VRKAVRHHAEKCQVAIDACKKNNRKLQIGYRLMYEPNNLALVDAVAKKECGELRIVEAASGFSIGDPTQWRLKMNMAGGGCLMDIGVYSLSAARYITREEPVEVQAMTYANRSDPRFKEVEETCNFQLRFPSGVVASCVSSYSTGFNRFPRDCTRGWAGVEPALSYNGNKFHIQRPGQQEDESRPGRPQPVRDGMDALADCIINNKQPKASGETGMQDVRIMMAIYEAAKTGKTVKL